MELKTIYFLQALWDVDVQKDKLIKIAKNAMLAEIDNKLKGAFHENTLWLSSDAKALRKQIEDIRNEIVSISQPGDLIRIGNELQSATVKIKAMQIKTMNAVGAGSGIRVGDVSILIRQLIPVAIKKMEKQAYFQLYRAMILTGNQYIERVKFPTQSSDFLEWYEFYKREVQMVIDSMDINTLDGRWAYERKEICLKNIYIEQYVSVQTKDNELKQRIGSASLGTGENGEYRLYGRGWITNISPTELSEFNSSEMITRMPPANYIPYVGDENNSPNEVMKKLLGERKFLISPNDYIEFINTLIITKTLIKRIRTSACLRCGEPRYGNKVCSKCGRLWTDK